MIVSPVIFSENTSLLGKWQALEFYSLVVSGAGAVSAGHPILCNGANLAYAKEAYLAVGGFTRGEMFASGDDTFLLFSIAARYGKHAIRFLKSYDAIVKTNAIATFSGFVRQRLRWVSKTRGYTDVWTIQTALVVFLFNTILLTGLCLGIFNTSVLRLTLIIWGVKILIDFPLLAGYTSFARQRRLLWGYLPLSLVYPFYICFFALAGQVWKPRWKGRK
jgi:cellulose synthase/poly-beta-1,6-N-acetylglucosamine synthase-like glycosyltransferase